MSVGTFSCVKYTYPYVILFWITMLVGYEKYFYLRDMSTNAKTFVEFPPGRLFRTGRLLNFFKNSTLDVYLDRTLIKFPTIIPPGRLFPPTLLLGRLE